MNIFLQSVDWLVFTICCTFVVGILVSGLITENLMLNNRTESARHKCEQWRKSRKKGLWKFIAKRAFPWVLGGMLLSITIIVLISGVMYSSTSYAHWSHDILMFLRYEWASMILVYTLMILLCVIEPLGLWLIRERHFKDYLELLAIASETNATV